jgi:hypothetical protein
MPNFHVVLSEVVMHEILVEAETAEAAEELAMTILTEEEKPERVAKDYYATSLGLTIDPFTEQVDRNTL